MFACISLLSTPVNPSRRQLDVQHLMRLRLPRHAKPVLERGFSSPVLFNRLTADNGPLSPISLTGPLLLHERPMVEEDGNAANSLTHGYVRAPSPLPYIPPPRGMFPTPPRSFFEVPEMYDLLPTEAPTLQSFTPTTEKANLPNTYDEEEKIQTCSKNLILVWRAECARVASRQRAASRMGFADSNALKGELKEIMLLC